MTWVVVVAENIPNADTEFHGIGGFDSMSVYAGFLWGKGPCAVDEGSRMLHHPSDTLITSAVSI